VGRRQRKRSHRSRPGTVARPGRVPPRPARPPSISQAHQASGTNPSATAKLRPEFWPGVLRAAGVEPRAASDIGGASGVRHGVIAVGVNEIEKRLVIVSAESDARGVALAQADIQSAMPEYKVIAVRPVMVSASQFASAISQSMGGGRISLRSLFDLQSVPEHERFETYDKYFSGVFKHIDQWVRNGASVESLTATQALKQFIDQATPVHFEGTEDDLFVDLTNVIHGEGDPTDIELGICGFPLYGMSEADLDSFSARGDVDQARDVLRKHGVLQYFFPAPDQLVLGAIDRGAVISSPDYPVVLAESLGHPAGQMELVPADTQLPDLIDALVARKLLVSGEVDVQVSEEGIKQRTNVRFSPREGIVSKILNRISVSIDLKQIIGLTLGARAGDSDSATNRGDASSGPTA
jgi:hypothetical protein